MRTSGSARAGDLARPGSRGMRIYLACTVRGDRGAVEGLRALVAALESSGHTILTKHLLDDNVDTAESALTERQVYERDIEWLEACDVLIADASGSSFGVGFEVGYVLGRTDRTDQRVVLLYRADRRDKVSRLIVGNAHPRCEVIAYDSPSQLSRAVPARLGRG
jgi:nucleoside 2-deoxyribosyltransferase